MLKKVATINIVTSLTVKLRHDIRTHIKLDKIFFSKLHVFKRDIFSISDCLTELELTLWYIGPELKRYLNYLTGLGLIL